MRILKSDEYHRMQWRNGRGETAQVAIAPPAATLDDFDWRVSMARIDDDGPFSIFPQTDRTLAILRGDGIRLSVAGTAAAEITRHSEPLSFSGNAAADATLIGSSVTDLNVMTHRERFTHSMRRLQVAGRLDVGVDAPLGLLICADRAVRVESNTQAFRLDPLDSLLLDETPSTISVSSDAPALVYLIEIRSVSASHAKRSMIA